MGLFRRRGATSPEPAAPDADVIGAAEAPAAEGADEGLIGPWDLEEVPELGDRIDLGAVRLPKRQGLQVRMELDKKTRRVVGVNLAVDGSALQVQAFAAPRSAGLWSTLRSELATQIGKQGGSVDERTGPFGTELLVRLPVRLPDGRSGHRPARFLGVDGPRWFLRGVLTGKAAVDADAGAVMESLFGDVVVVRGPEPRPPRDLLPLHMPGQRAGAPEQSVPTLDLPGSAPVQGEAR
ncbi:DUF3710 domain-containing protein [Ruania halotolerans]|uniref:DUF3710 domain-containing protein n=1 Tax=Ruania halotolerans TaxID=2897773 RepID=UPI001E4FAA22|nr:DUF3710 domain-containing protein [Ruania halotolerans]UFU04803.1 DUF3710 domain-containing protein [Ruania halotolerans]